MAKKKPATEPVTEVEAEPSGVETVAVSHEGGTVQVTFIKSYRVRDECGTSYAAGSTVSMSESSAAHFISRGVAVEKA